MEKLFIVNGNRKIEFVLTRKNVRNLNLRIKSDASVVVSANFNVPSRTIIDFVKRKADWIVSKQDDFALRQSKISANRNFFEIKNFNKEEAMKIFGESTSRISKEIALGFIPQIKIRRMRARWGSCAINKKTITLNAALLKTDVSCLDYVVLHELLHFNNAKHDKAFYQSMACYLPDWKAKKKQLRGYIFEKALT